MNRISRYIDAENAALLNNACLSVAIFEHAPFFIYESEIAKFYAVRSVSPTLDRVGMFKHNEEIGTLVLGEDIEEITIESNGEDSLRIEAMRDDYFPYLISGLRDFSKELGEKFVSYRPNQTGDIGVFHPTSNPRIISIEVIPRIFRKKYDSGCEFDYR